jgi:hypothetical protein
MNMIYAKAEGRGRPFVASLLKDSLDVSPFNYWSHKQFKLESTQTDKKLPPMITIANKTTTLY